MDNEKLVNLAKTAMIHSYSPYSRFKVGAAALSDEGSIYTGCNIENASYGATMCAERVAIYASIADGNKSIKKIVNLEFIKEVIYHIYKSLRLFKVSIMTGIFYYCVTGAWKNPC